MVKSQTSKPWINSDPITIKTSNLSKAHVTCNSRDPATLAISVGVQQ